MKFKRIAALTMTGALLGSLCTGAFAEENQNQTILTLSVADPYDSDYVMTIPTDLTITSDGFNALSGLKVAHNPEKTETTFDPNKKVTVTATSGNEWQLKATGVADGIGYKLKAADTDKNATTSWEFTSAEITNDGTTKPLGVDVESYENAEAGEYTDTITFTAKVESTAVAVTGIELNKTSTLLGIGNKETLSVSSITPDDATDKTVVWSSDNEAVATVNSETGEVTAVAKGTANITATANDGSGKTATCEVKVTALAGALQKDATISVYFKWRGGDRGDYVTGTYDGTSFTASKGGGYWGDNERAVYEVTKNGNKITIRQGVRDYTSEAQTWTFDAENDTYTYTKGDIVNRRPDNYGLISVKVNGTDITGQLTAQ